jgi:hypothetical protein
MGLGYDSQNYIQCNSCKGDQFFSQAKPSFICTGTIIPTKGTHEKSEQKDFAKQNPALIDP